MQQVLAAAIQCRARHDMAASTHERGNGQVQGGLAAGYGNCANAAFERCHALLQHGIGRVADATVDVARSLQVEQAGRVVAGFKDKGRGQMNWHRACTRGRVGLRACMQAQVSKPGSL